MLNDNDNRLLKKYTKMWERVSSLINIEFDSEPVYGDNDKYIKPKIKLYEDKKNITFWYSYMLDILRLVSTLRNWWFMWKEVEENWFWEFSATRSSKFILKYSATVRSDY